MKFDPTDIRAQERRQADDMARAKRIADQESKDLQWLMGQKRGRRIVRGVIERSQFNLSAFNTNAMTMSFVAGRQLEGSRLVTLAQQACPDLYLKMLIEANEEPDDRASND